MTWFLFAFLTAAFESLKDVVSKKTLPRTNEYVVAWAWVALSVPFQAVATLLLEGVPHLEPSFWLALLASTAILTFSLSWYMKAIRLCDLSLTIPMIAFTPMFMLLTSPLMIGEYPSPAGIVGVILIVAGSYVLNISEMGNGWKGLLAPYRALMREKGTGMMLFVAFVWSINANIDRVGIQSSSPLFWITCANAAAAVAMTPLMLWKTKERPGTSTPFRSLLLIGFLGALVGITQMTALTMTIVPYVIAVKRLSVIMTVLSGHLLFQEKGLKERLTGVIIMITGVLLITLF